MAIGYRQSTSTWPTTSASTTALSYASPLSTGSLLVGVAIWNSASVTCSFSDGQSNAWVSIGGPLDGLGALVGFRIQMFYAPNAIGAPTSTVTATFSSAVTRRGIAIHEYIGADLTNPLDATAIYSTQLASTTHTTGSVAVSASGGLVTAAAITSGAIASVNSPFAYRANASIFGDNATADYAIGIGSYAATFNELSTAQDAAMVIASFRSTGYDDHKNFAYSTVATAPSPATTGTSLVVQAGEGLVFPAPPFNATIWPTGTTTIPVKANSEIVTVTAVTTDTLTISRHQESSNARTVIVGDQIAAGATAKTATDLEKGALLRSSALDFTDGSLVKRFTISDAAVVSTSAIVCATQRNVTETTDTGLMYEANVASITAGSFDVIVWAIDGEWGVSTPYPLPSESVTLVYSIF